MNVPFLTASALGAFLLYEMNRGMTPREAATSALTPGPMMGACTEKYCPPNYLIHVDKPVNTVLRDDTLGGATLSGAYQYVKSQYLKEAREAPGVRLVAHTVA
mgnify:CR=1 FL=1